MAEGLFGCVFWPFYSFLSFFLSFLISFFFPSILIYFLPSFHSSFVPFPFFFLSFFRLFIRSFIQISFSSVCLFHIFRLFINSCQASFHLNGKIVYTTRDQLILLLISFPICLFFLILFSFLSVKYYRWFIRFFL